MASDSIFESFPSYPQCFMRGEYALGFSYLLLLSVAGNEVAACCNLVQREPLPVPCLSGIGGIQTRAYDFKTIGLLLHQMAPLQKCSHKYLVELLKGSVGG